MMQYCRRNVARVAASALSLAALVGAAPMAHAAFYDSNQTVTGADPGPALVGSVNAASFTVTFTSTSSIATGLLTFKNSKTNLYGSIGSAGVSAFNSSHVSVHGGVNSGSYSAFDTSVITFYGSNLSVTLLGGTGPFIYALGGTLTDGTSLSGKGLTVASGASYVLVDSVPEPGAVAFGATAGLFTLGVIARRRRAA